MSYSNNGNNALKVSMINLKTMCWEQSGHMAIHFIYYAYTHTALSKVCPVCRYFVLHCWQNQAAELE